MKNKLIVVTDLGSFKAYRLDQNELNSTPRLELVEEFDTLTANIKTSDQMTDQPGRFPKGTGVPNVGGELSAGERHNIELEQRRRLIKQLAERIDTVVQREQVDLCYFAAGSEINKAILEELPARTRDCIAKNVTSNLTKADRDNILRHFEVMS